MKACRQTYGYIQGRSGLFVSLWLTPNKRPVFGKARHISEPEREPQAEEWRLNVIDWEERSLTSPSTHCPLLSGFIYIKETWGKGKGCNNTCTQPVNPTVTEILKTRTPLQCLKPKSSLPCFFFFFYLHQNFPHPFSTLSQVFSSSSSPPLNHRSFLLVSIQLYNIHAQRKEKEVHLVISRRCWTFKF